MPPSFNERRMYPRQKTFLIAKYSFDDGTGGIAWVKDISYGGACLFTNREINVGSQIDLGIILPTVNKRYSIKSRVVFSENDTVRVEFTEANISDLNRIFEFIQSVKSLRESYNRKNLDEK